jgi:hypothetical protein
VPVLPAATTAWALAAALPVIRMEERVPTVGVAAVVTMTALAARALRTRYGRRRPIALRQDREAAAAQAEATPRLAQETALPRVLVVGSVRVAAVVVA